MLGPTYKFPTSHGPLRMSFKDLGSLIDSIRAQVGPPNRAGKHEYVAERLSLAAHEGASMTFEDGFDVSVLEDIPWTCSDVWYRYERSNEGAEDRVWLHWSDMERRTEVDGRDKKRAEAIRAVVNDFARQHSVFFSGELFRGIVKAIAATAALGLGVVVKKPGFSTVPWAIVLLFFAILNDRTAPGTSVLAGEVSWVKRNSAEVTLVGTALGILSIVLTALMSGWLS